MAVALELDHLVLISADVDKTLAWYQEHAGLEGERFEEWRRGEAPFPSLRINENTIIDVVPGETGEGRGHVDHICMVVSPEDLATLKDNPKLAIVDEGPRFGARGLGESIYVNDPDGLMVEFRCYK